MDTRPDHGNLRPPRLHPQTPLLLVLALMLLPALARPARGQAGNFLGSLTDAPATVQTDTGPQSTTVDGDLLLTVGSDSNGSRPFTLSSANLVASEVATGSGGSGVLGFTLTASGTTQVGADGHLDLPVTFSVHYPLIDSFFPPTPNPNAPGDAPKPFFEAYTGTLSGSVSFDTGSAAYTFNGALHLAVTGASTGKILSVDVPFSRFSFELDEESASLAAAGEECPPGRRCKERTLKICPIRIRAAANDASPTGSSIDNQIEKARQVWRQCCIELDVQGTDTITEPALKVVTAGDDLHFSNEENTLYGKVDHDKCLEIFFIDKFDPRHSRGDGVTKGSGTASCKIISADDGNATNSVLLAHELGHCLNLEHSDGGVMTPTGQPSPNPPGQGSFNVPLAACAKIKQPLLRRTKKDCCKTTCTGNDTTPPSCSAKPSGNSLLVTVQDVGSGLRTIQSTKEVNASLKVGTRVSGFVNGSTQEFNFTVDKTNPELPSAISLKVQDVCGNTRSCDPLIALIVREPGRPVTQTLTQVAGTEGLLLVANHTPGLRKLLVMVNGVRFQLNGLRDGEEQTLDFSFALRPGTRNVVTLTAQGKPGGSATVMIHD